MRISEVNDLIVKAKGNVDYQHCLEEMQSFTLNRSENTSDEIWLVEHPSVYTQGVAGKAEHLLNSKNEIPLIQSDRGGQITYHGPGQLILYPLLNIKRLNINTRELVQKLEHTIISTLATINIKAETKTNAPGVYVKQKKIASIGLRVKKGCCYHGIALNVNMSLTPYKAINPCGYQGLEMCQIIDLSPKITIQHIQTKIINAFIAEFRYTSVFHKTTISV